MSGGQQSALQISNFSGPPKHRFKQLVGNEHQPKLAEHGVKSRVGECQRLGRHDLERHVGNASLDRAAKAVSNPGRSALEDGTHGLRQIGHFNAKLHGQAFALAFLERLRVLPDPPVIHQALAHGQPGLAEDAIDISEVVVEIVFEQRLAEGILGAEVMIEGAFRHARGGKNFVQAYAGIPLCGHDALADVEDSLTDIR